MERLGAWAQSFSGDPGLVIIPQLYQYLCSLRIVLVREILVSPLPGSPLSKTPKWCSCFSFLLSLRFCAIDSTQQRPFAAIFPSSASVWTYATAVAPTHGFHDSSAGSFRLLLPLFSSGNIRLTIGHFTRPIETNYDPTRYWTGQQQRSHVVRGSLVCRSRFGACWGERIDQGTVFFLFFPSEAWCYVGDVA